jgi:hypothetical protein
MAQVLIDDINLTNIANAIRNKGGTTAKLKPSAMATAINNLTVGNGSGSGSGGVSSSLLTITDYADYAFASWFWSRKFLDVYGSQITTNNIETANYMFKKHSATWLSEVPFAINFTSANIPTHEAEGMFYGCSSLTAVPALVNFTPITMKDMFWGCSSLTDISGLLDGDYSLANKKEASEINLSGMFNGCSSLRVIPTSLLQQLEAGGGAYGIANASILNHGFTDCYSLDKLEGVSVPIWPNNRHLIENMFINTFDNLRRAKSVIFKNNSSATTMSNQCIDLSVNVGYGSPFGSEFTNSNRITNDTSYANLKTNIDSWTTSVYFSRYNKYSAIDTINSLPNTRTTDANGSSTSGNTIKFKGLSGRDTDGGAIENLTAEQIAVASNKGWTVAFV